MNTNKLYIDAPMKEVYEEYIGKEYFSKNKLKIEEIENGFILPAKKRFMQREPLCGNGGVLDSNCNYVESSAQLGFDMSDRLNGKYSFDKNKVEYIDEEVIYLNHFIKHWGHFLIDVIGRFWYKSPKYKYVMTIDLNQDLYEISGSFKEFIKYSGIDLNQIIIINKPTKFKKIIIPESSIYPGKYYTKEYISIFNDVINNCPKKRIKDCKKIYLSRKMLNNNKEIGEEKIEKFFNRNGYTSVFMETLSLAEQISYIQNSDEIACISGTLPHNILFSKKNTKLIILNKTYTINSHQFLVNEAACTNCTYIDIHKSLLPILYGLGPFIIKPTSALKDFSSDNNYIFEYDLDNKKWRTENIKYIIKYMYINRLRIPKDKFVKIKTLYNYYRKK